MTEPERSRFWDMLATRHQEDLDRHGYDAMKRHQAFEYFTWQWGWRGALLNPQVRFLLGHTKPSAWAAAWRAPVLTDDRWEGVGWSRTKRRIYTAIVRLLWDYAHRHGDLRVLELSEPELGSPLPVYRAGRLISQDIANGALEVATMAPVLDRPRSFLEVGAGYGRSAYVLLSLYPDATYTIVDIEPALSISRWYLNKLFDPARLRFIDAGQLGAIEPVDVAFTISTLQEMTPPMVSSYLDLFDRVAGAVYIKQWTRWRNPHDEVTMTMAEYPYPARWRRLHWAAARVQTRFTEGLWKVG